MEFWGCHGSSDASWVWNSRGTVSQPQRKITGTHCSSSAPSQTSTSLPGVEVAICDLALQLQGQVNRTRLGVGHTLAALLPASCGSAVLLGGALLLLPTGSALPGTGVER